MDDIDTSNGPQTPSEDRKISMQLELTDSVRVYKQRFLVCIAFAVNSMVNGMIWITFAPIQAKASTYFNVSNSLINMFSVVFLIAYIPGSILCTWMFRKYGLRKSFIFSSALQMIGCLIRWIGTISSIHSNTQLSFSLVLIGQTLGSISQPFFLNSPARLAAEWFSKEGRDIATGILCIVNPIGIGLGSIIPTIFVTDNGNKNGGFAAIMMLEWIVSIIACILVIVLLSDKPPTPPSMSQHLKKQQSTNAGDLNNTLMDDMKTIMRNRNFVFLLCGFTLGVGLFNALLTLINQYTAAFGYTIEDAGNFGALIMCGGIIGSIVAGALMEWLRQYRSLLKGCAVITALFLMILCVELKEDNVTALLIIFFFIGFFAVPILALAFESAAECTYPVNEELTTGVLMASGCLVGVFFLLIWESQLPDSNNGYNNSQNNFSTYFVIVLAVIMTVFICLFKGEYKRLNASVNDNNNDTNEILNGRAEIDSVSPTSTTDMNVAV